MSESKPRSVKVSELHLPKPFPPIARGNAVLREQDGVKVKFDVELGGFIVRDSGNTWLLMPNGMIAKLATDTKPDSK